MTRTYVLMHPLAKMLNSCFDIFARIHNNLKEPLIVTFKILFTMIKSMAVVRFNVLHFTVEALHKFMEYIHQVENLLGVIAHHCLAREKRAFPRTILDGHFYMRATVGRGQAEPIASFPPRHHRHRSLLPINFTGRTLQLLFGRNIHKRLI